MHSAFLRMSLAGFLVLLAGIAGAAPTKAFPAKKPPAKASAVPAPAAKAPPYVWAKAFYILPETTSEESGYFSLCEGRNGKIYVGTAKYKQNAYLVEFDPQTEKQRIVIDVNKLCGLTASGYAAQAKIHTRNFVGPSGKIYVGSKQGYPDGPNDKTVYPGGYAMFYDPAADAATNLGLPFPGQGIIDIVADEGRGLLYVVTCEDQHWMRGDLLTGKYRELGPLLTPYATTLLDSQGRANAITRDFRLAQYDPVADKVAVRDIILAGRKLGTNDNAFGPMTWVSAPDAKAAYLIRMSEPSLFRIELGGAGAEAKAENLGPMISGKGFDSRSALSVGPDGRVYAVIKISNDTGFGGGSLHHLVRYDPKVSRMEDLGVLAVKNPDFFDFGPGPDGKPKAHAHGYHKLPDGTLTPLHHHMALMVVHDGTVYVTILYPFTLLKIDPIK